ncbi:MAG: DUF4293 domain-containing protein [Prevotella sp.]|nr:DUF4293 domain-containing protein [Prevotella sp.]
MIQRKQTIYLLLAAIVSIVCLCLPLGSITLEAMGIEPVLYNLALAQPLNNGVQYDYSYAPLFGVLVLTIILEVVAIFMYKNRPRQSRICTLNIALLLVWMGIFLYYKYISLVPIGVLEQTVGSYLPFVAAVLNYLAFKGIRADERLVRAADRIR